MNAPLDRATINRVIKILRQTVATVVPTEYGKGYRRGYNNALTDVRYELNDILKRNKRESKQ